jgi:outer membrane protein TolC
VTREQRAPTPLVRTVAASLVLAGTVARAAGAGDADTLGATDTAAVVRASRPAPPVEELVALALGRAPNLAAQRARQAATAARVAVANALPDPMLEVMFQDAGFPDYTVGEEEMSMIAVELRQNLLFFRKRGARRKAAQAESEQVAAEVGELESRVTAEVRRIYARLYALDRTHATLAAARDLTQLLAATVAARTGTGQVEWESQVKAQLATTRLEERMDDLLAQREAEVATLNRYLDSPPDTPLGEVRQLPEVRPPDGSWVELALARSPQVAARRAAQAAAELRLEAERRDVAPNLFASAGYAHRGGLDHLGVFRLGAELPLWRRGKSVAVSEHELAMARHELRDAQAMARAEAERLAAAWRNADTQVRRYREAILQQTSAAIDAARASYITGQTDFSTLVEDYNLWLEAREQLALREAERFSIWAELEALLSAGGVPATDEGGAR